MADVEVKLDIKAEAKAALAAVESLGKKLDELQSKSRLLVSGGAGATAQGGSSTKEGTAPDAGQQAAVEAWRGTLVEVNEEIARVRAALEELAKLPSVPPDAVVDVNALASGYRELEAGIAAVAAASRQVSAVSPQAPAAPQAPETPAASPDHGLIGVEDIRDRLAAEEAAMERFREELRQLNAERSTSVQAAETSIEEEEQLSYAMSLTSMSAQELAREVERLAEARRMAAQQGDAAAMEQYGRQMQMANRELQRARREQQVMRIGMLQQAQLALQLGGSLQGFAESCRDGSVSMSGLVNTTLAFGTALKAGLGPIGWTMLAIQGLQTAWDWYNESQKEAARNLRQLQTEKLQRDSEELRKAAEAYREAGRAYRAAVVESYKEYNTNLLNNIRREEELGQQRAELQNKLLDAEDAHRQKMLRTQLAAAEKGDKERLQKELENIALVKSERIKADAEAAARAAEFSLETMEKALARDKYKDLLQIKLPDLEALQQLEVRLKSSRNNIIKGVSEEEKRQMEVQVAAVHNEMRRIAAVVKEIDGSIHGSDKQIIETVRNIQETRKESEAALEQQRKTVEARRQEAELAKTQHEYRLEEARAEREAAERKEAASAAIAAREEEWTDVQKRSLAEQEQWLTKQLMFTKLSADEQKRVSRALQKVKLEQVQEELNGLAEAYKVSGSYAVKEARTQEEIYAADRAALRAREAQLKKLAAAPGLDAATQEEINDKLAETRGQLAGLEEALQESAETAQKGLQNLQPLGQKALTAGAQHALKRAEAAFAALARKAERQASAGDTAGLERTLGQMRRAALAQEQLTGFTGRAAAAMKQVEEQTQALASGLKAEDRGLTAQQRQQNEVLEALGMKRRWTSKAAKAAERGSRAAEKEQRAQEKAARAAEAAAQKTAQEGKSSGDEGAGQVAALQQQLAAANATVAAQNTQLVQLQGALAELARLAAAGQGAAAACASTAGAGVQELGGQLAALRREHEALRRAVENLRRF